MTQAKGQSVGSNPFQFSSASMIGTSEGFKGTFNLGMQRGSLARELPRGLADIVKNSSVSGYQMQTKMSGLSASQQEALVGQMRAAVSNVPGLSQSARSALADAHAGRTSLVEVNAGISAALRRGAISSPLALA